jgi:hypothetical protein
MTASGIVRGDVNGKRVDVFAVPLPREQAFAELEQVLLPGEHLAGLDPVLHTKGPVVRPGFRARISGWPDALRSQR